MIKGTKALIFLLTISWTSAFSQQLSHQVLVPLAGVIPDQKSIYSYSQTVGETAVQIVSCEVYIFTQGFQQPRIKVSPEDPPEGNGVEVFPNPVTDELKIKLYGETARTFRIEFINITGTIIFTDKKVFYDQFFYDGPGYDVSGLIRGFYLMRIYSEDGVINRIFKIEKI